MTLAVLVLAATMAAAAPQGLQDGPAGVRAYIARTSPRMAPGRAQGLARAIAFAARAWGVPPLLLAGIVRQESSFRSGLRRRFVVHGRCREDAGLAQVNDVWVRAWGLEAERLVEDDAYGLWVGAKVLAGLRRRYGHREPRRWWSRYHSATPGPRRAYELALGTPGS